MKHEQLTKDENELTEKLQNEVTKTKEKLENYLSNSNNLIINNERIEKGIKILDKKEKNKIIDFTYISKINKCKNEINILFQKLMKNINISFNDKKYNNILFEEYYFNGIPSPKNIEIKNIKYRNFEVFWNIDDTKAFNLDNSQIKYRVQYRKENEKFQQFYEGKLNNCIINKYKTKKY